LQAQWPSSLHLWQLLLHRLLLCSSPCQSCACWPFAVYSSITCSQHALTVGHVPTRSAVESGSPCNRRQNATLSLCSHASCFILFTLCLCQDVGILWDRVHTCTIKVTPVSPLLAWPYGNVLRRLSSWCLSSQGGGHRWGGCRST
jgi:hypothetical protein